MDGQSVWIILAVIFVIGCWAVYVYSRHQTAEARRAEAAKYAVWDTAYRKALKAGKTEYYAMLEAVKAVGAGPRILKVWDDAYNKAINEGLKKHRASITATRVARRAAHS